VSATTGPEQAELDGIRQAPPSPLDMPGAGEAREGYAPELSPEPGAPPIPDAPPAWRLIATLGVGGALAGLLLSLVHAWAEPRITAHKAHVLEMAVHEVLRAPERQEPLFLVDGRLTPDLPAGADPAKLEKVFIGYRDERPVGYAIASSEAGFQDQILVLFGYDPGTSRVLAMKVLESRETPGLGDKIEKDDAFVTGFHDAVYPMVGVKQGSSDPANRAQVDMITGATISARVVIRIINNAIERWTPLIDAYEGQSP
jgi:Na+-translocating ferredoxin:NAD+ oxidoreductase subunit G